MTFIAKNYRKFKKQVKRANNNRNNSSGLKCFCCNKFDHIIKERPLKNNEKKFKNKNKFEKFNKKKKSAFQATWDDSDCSSISESDSDTKHEIERGLPKMNFKVNNLYGACQKGKLKSHFLNL